MITTVTLNPCFDHTVFVDRLIPGGHNKALSSRRDLAGKGINVSLALEHLGCPSTAFVLMRAENRADMDSLFTGMDIRLTGVTVPGRLRTNLKVTEPDAMTEINEKGEPVPADTAERVCRALEQCLPENGILTLCGSIPPGLPADIYARLIRMAEGKKVRTVLDTSGAPLEEGLKAKPFLLKPNALELSQLLGREVEDEKTAAEAAEELVRNGVELVCVSLGEKGAVLVNAEERWYAPALPLQVLGFQGAGDSMVAGFCRALESGLSCPELLRSAVAAASASLVREGTLLCTAEEYVNMLQLVELQRI